MALLPIKKAFIKFEMNILNFSGDKEDNLPAKTTQPKDKGSNPSMNSALNFELNLPVEGIFMPQLQCEVYDYIFSGMLNIKKLVDDTNKQIMKI